MRTLAAAAAALRCDGTQADTPILNSPTEPDENMQTPLSGPKILHRTDCHLATQVHCVPKAGSKG